jgi:hypothetical protein
VPVPAGESRRDVGEEGSLEFAGLEAGFPDAALEGFEGGGFAVAVHEPEEVGEGGVIASHPFRGKKRNGWGTGAFLRNRGSF